MIEITYFCICTMHCYFWVRVIAFLNSNFNSNLNSKLSSFLSMADEVTIRLQIKALKYYLSTGNLRSKINCTLSIVN